MERVEADSGRLFELPERSLYPYAAAPIFEFLKAAIEAKAHEKIPSHFGCLADREDRWVRMRNMAGTYFSCWITLSEIGEQYQFKSSNWKEAKERPRQLIDHFLRYLWENSPEDVRKHFPREDLLRISPMKPIVKRGNRQAISLLACGSSLEEVAKRTNVTRERVSSLRRRVRRLGILDNPLPEAQVKKGLKADLVDFPDGFEKWQEIMDQVTVNIYKRNRHFFKSIDDIRKEAGWGKRPTLGRLDWVVAAFHSQGIAVGHDSYVMNGKVFRYHFIHCADLEKAVGILRSLEDATKKG